jgi:hypothetical protein
MNDEENIIKVLENLDRGSSFKPPEQGTFTPTLVVGLGGTGTRVLRQLKKHLGQERANRVHLLGIDSDKAENDKFGMPPLTDSELCLLEPDRAITWLDRYAAGDPDYEWLTNVLQETGPENSIEAEIRQKIKAGAGCGQRRRAGRLMFSANVNGGANVRGRLNHLHQELRGLAKSLEHIHSGLNVDSGSQIFVVSSFAGGTGAGIIMETLALLGSVFDGPNDNITVIGLLPGRALDRKLYDARNEKGFTRGNAIGVLRELEALRKPGGPKREFRFGARDSIICDPSQQHIANNVYLVDNECGLRGGYPVTEWDELIAATGWFLYNFFENGVGASAFSGEVNYAPTTATQGAVYRAFGVGSLRYPIDDIVCYSLFSLAESYLSEITKEGTGIVKKAKKAHQQTMGELGLRGISDFLKLFNEVTIDEASFMGTDAQWKSIKGASDNELTAAGREAERQMADSMPDYDARCAEIISLNLERLEKTVKDRILSLITGNQAVVRQHNDLLLKDLEKWQEDLNEEVEALDKKIKNVENRKRQVEQKIHKLDFFLDIKHRSEYRGMIQSLLSSRESRYRLGHVGKVITDLLEYAGVAQSRCNSVSQQLKAKKTAFRSTAGRYAALLNEGVFIQSAMNADDTKDWLKKVDAKIECHPAKDWSVNGVLLALVEPLYKSLKDNLRSKDIVLDAFKKGNKSLVDKLDGVDAAGKPLIALKSTAPSEEDLTPQKYVLAVSAKLKEKELIKVFPQVGENQTKMQPLDVDKSSATCLTTVVGYDISDLKRFDEFYDHYAASPWLFHTVENHNDLPPLNPRMETQSLKYRNFGLALFFEAVYRKGNNYYANIVRSPRKNQAEFKYLVYSKERNSYAKALMYQGIAAEAPKSQTRPVSSQLISKSLEGTLEEICGPKYTEFAASITDLWETYLNQIGRQTAKTEIESFASDTVDGLIARTRGASKRKECLRLVREELLGLADGIE